MKSQDLLQLFPVLHPQDFTDYKYGYDIVHTGIVIHPSGIDPYLATKEEMVHQVLNIGGTPQHLSLCSTLPIKVGSIVLHERGWIGKVREEKYNDLPEVEVDWFGKEAETAASRTSLIYIKKIEFTTDPKLWDIRMVDVILGKTENIGVPAIDGNTKCYIITPSSSLHGKQYNFLEEYCKRYNQKNITAHDVAFLGAKIGSASLDKYSQKGVDVENTMTRENILLKIKKLGTVYNHESLCDSIMNSHNQSLQSNSGGFSKGDLFQFVGFFNEKSKQGVSHEAIFKEFQSLPKERPKGDIIIKCEMEKIEWSMNINPTTVGQMKIKLVNGQPIIHFENGKN